MRNIFPNHLTFLKCAAQRGAGADGAPVPRVARHGAARHTAKPLVYSNPDRMDDHCDNFMFVL
jgi:hypothetical protein